MFHGLYEILPAELNEREQVTNIVKQRFQNNGFNRITTPTFEPFEPLAKGWGEYLKEESIQFFNNEGVQMSLRPEMTSSVARLVGSYQDQLELPLKLYYLENVFRKNHIFRRQEYLQIGCEFIGDGDIQAELDLIKIVIDLFESLNIKGLKIEIGHVENINNKTKKEIKALLGRKYQSLQEVPAIGGPDVLAVDSYLKTFHDQLLEKYPDCLKNVVYNLGLVKEISYYTGIVFNILVEGCGYIIGTGGRYNNLLKQYGWDTPAVGFAIEYDKLAAAFKPPQV